MSENNETSKQYLNWRAPKVTHKEKEQISTANFSKVQEIMDKFQLYDELSYHDLIVAAYFSNENFNYQVVNEDDYYNSSEESPKDKCGIFLLKDKTAKITNIKSHSNYLAEMKYPKNEKNIENLFFASGQNPYFASQIDENGLGSARLLNEDMVDIKFLQQIFKTKSPLSIVDRSFYATYCVVPGGREYEYANDSLPAIVAEEAFGCAANHSFNVQPKVGESEIDFIVRHLESKIDSSIDEINRKKILAIGRKLASKFVTNESHIYIIPCKEILDNKVSFGDVNEMRNGQDGNVELQTLRQTIDNFHVTSFTKNPNFDSDNGLAVYGIIDSKKIFRLKMPSRFVRLQQYVQNRGLSVGMEISPDVIQDFEKNRPMTKSLVD
jgi:WD40 repeat protein